LIYYAHCEMTLVFFLYYSGEIVSLFQHWVETERLLNLRQIFLGKITKAQCWLIFIATVILSNLENGFYITSAVCCVSLKVNLQIIINKFIVFIFTR
jgi:hypothetical protein